MLFTPTEDPLDEMGPDLGRPPAFVSWVLQES